MARLESFIGPDGVVPVGTEVRAVDVEKVVTNYPYTAEPTTLDDPKVVVSVTTYVSRGRNGLIGPEFVVAGSTDPTRYDPRRPTPKVVELRPGFARILGSDPDDPLRRALAEAGIEVVETPRLQVRRRA